LSRSYEFSVGSLLDAPPDHVWSQVTSYEGINYELRPFLRMSAPEEVRRRGLDGVVLGERLCRSWILLFGVVPIDYDDITPVRLEPERGFLERSPMLSQRLWEHERTLEPVAGGCRLTDRVRFEPRLPFGGSLMLPIARAIFRHRHRRLRRAFGHLAPGR
jgi:ligand-binding SRPBCC domain-containing protein